MRTWIVSIGLASVALALAPLARGAEPGASGVAATPAATLPELKTLTVDEVSSWIASAAAKKRNTLFVFDNNPPETYEKRHLPGAAWLVADELKPSDLPGDKAAALLFYCYNER